MQRSLAVARQPRPALKTRSFKPPAECVDTDYGYENRMDYPAELRMIGCVHLTTAVAG